MGVVQKIIDYPQLIHPPRLLLLKKGSWELKSSMGVRRCWVSTAVLAVVVVMPGGCMVPSTGDLANSSESRALIASRPQYSNKICWIEKSRKLFFCLDSPPFTTPSKLLTWRESPRGCTCWSSCHRESSISLCCRSCMHTSTCRHGKRSL